MAEDKELVLVEDDEDQQEQSGKETEYVAVEEPIKEDDEKPQAKNTDDDDDEDGDTDEERAAIRERRRLEKKERKERQQKAIGRDKVELNFLRQRNDELERRMMALETNTQKMSLSEVDRQIQAAIEEADTAERIIAKAVEAGNGEDVAKALKYRDQAIAKANQLHMAKQQQQGQQRQQPGLDKALEHFASEFMETNSWYDPQGRDEDSAIVLAIDGKLAQEGYDPRTEEYWDELQSRIEKRLPEKFERQAKNAQPQRKPTGGPAIGSGREHAPSSTRKEIYISPERKAAMQEAGVWDDPVLRSRYIKRYAEYDKANANN
jgi:hypothetical protein